MNMIHLVLCFMLIIQAAQLVHFDFTKISCNVTDPSYAIIEKCILKPIARHRQYVSLKTKVLHLPIYDAKMRFKFMKKENEWKQWLYDVTIGCDFLKKSNPLGRMLSSLLKNQTNINHDCPYDHDIELYRLENTYVGSSMLMNLPVPAGQYAMFVTFIAENDPKALIKFYGIIS